MFAFNSKSCDSGCCFKTMRVSEAINNFLLRKRETHNGPDLIDRILSFRTDLELQINVDTRGAEQTDRNRWRVTDLSILILGFRRKRTRCQSGTIGGCVGRWVNSARPLVRPVLIGGGARRNS